MDISQLFNGPLAGEFSAGITLQANTNEVGSLGKPAVSEEPLAQPVRLTTGTDVEVFPALSSQARLVSHRIVEADGAAVQIQGYLVPKSVTTPAAEHLFLDWTGVANESMQEVGSKDAPIILITKDHKVILRAVSGNANYFPTFYRV